MRIVVSDYDGTLYEKGQLVGDVVGAVTAWRNKGNRFGIATGRDFSMTRPEIERWQIPADFVVCINGAAVYDADYSLLASHLLDDDMIPVILAHPAGEASLHYQLSGLEPLRVHLRADSHFWGANIQFERVTREQAFAVKNIGQISLAYKTQEESEKWTNAINNDLGDRVHAHRNKHMIDVTRFDVNKAKGVASVLEAKGWSEDSVTAIGDGTNDIPMIRAYSGYVVEGATEDVQSIGNRQFKNVPELLNGIG